MLASTTRAAYDLKARSRWAVTGTPIQNRLTDLFSLLKFVRAYPYDEKRTFDSHIAHLVRQGDEEMALVRMRRLLRSMMLRRCKELPLPKKTELLVELQLSATEAQQYNDAKNRALSTIDDALTLMTTGNMFRNVLQKIETLRQICTIGCSNTCSTITPARSPARSPARESSWDQDSATRSFMHIFSLGRYETCLRCSTPLLSASPSSRSQPSVYLTECLRGLCWVCHDSFLRTDGGKQVCACDSACDIAPVVASDLPEDYQTMPPKNELAPLQIPTKVRVLVDDLQKQTPTTKRSAQDEVLTQLLPRKALLTLC